MTDLEVLEHASTPIGTIYLGRRHAPGVSGWVHEIQIDGALLMSSIDPVSERELATRALAMHPEVPRRILVGGLGLGYTAAAAREGAPDAEIVVVEKMDFVIDWMSRGLLPLSAAFADDGRLSVVQGDIYGDLLGPPASTYDVIVVDVDHAPDNPLSPASQPFYTPAGQRQVARHLSPGGVLAVWSATTSPAFAEVMAEVYADARCDTVQWPDHEHPERPYCNVLFLGRLETGQG
ncbi:MAG: spermidine synthase [Myxococcota bacterium]